MSTATAVSGSDRGPGDNLAKDLAGIVDEVFDGVLTRKDRDMLMQKLTIYINRRDSKVWNHAFKLGKEKASNESQR
jgi:hypothetical protein